MEQKQLSAEDYLKSAEIAEQVLSFAQSEAKKGAGVLAYCESVEEKISSLGGRPAFPVNISVNEVAAHYTPPAGSEEVFSESVVNIDVGVHVNGAIMDFAFTKDFSGEHGKLVEASELALQNALSAGRAGVHTSKIGGEIERTIRSFGFKPIENLTGHGLGPYNVHSDPSIPNVGGSSGGRILREGEIVAVEPFASTGSGKVRDRSVCEIFSLEPEARFGKGLLRMKHSREVLAHCLGEHLTLPFAKRWLEKRFSKFSISVALKDIEAKGFLVRYPVLADTSGSFVSQAERTAIVRRDCLEPFF